MQIAGLAIPYGVPNSYNETFTPDTLDGGNLKGYLKSLSGLPMFWDHDPDWRAGWWTDFDSTPSGLYVRGLVADDGIIERIKRTPDAKRKLSVTYGMWGTRNMRRTERVIRNGVYEPITIGQATLAEISIVESPAWKESFYQVIA